MEAKDPKALASLDWKMGKGSKNFHLRTHVLEDIHLILGVVLQDADKILKNY